MSLPEGWRETTLGEVIKTANTGLDAIKRAPIVSENTGIKCFRIQDASQSKEYSDWGFTSVNESNYEKFRLLQGDILIARTGNTIGVHYLVRNNMKAVFNNGLIRLRVKENIRYDFLYHIITSRIFYRYIQSIAYGTSTQPNMQINTLLNFDILLPPLQEQKAIASMLSSFDEKIELLKAQNETLEQMAQGVFREWFVDGVDESWEVGTLKEEFTITMGQSPKGSSYNEDAEGTIFYQGRAEFQSRFPKRRLYTTEPKRYADKFDVLMSVRAPVGDINVASEKCCIGRGLAGIHSEYKSYLLYKMKFLKKQLDVFESEGTVFGSINKTSLENLEVIIPHKSIVEKYNLFALPIDKKIFNNYEQIQTLQKTRDTLLPKLMSGKLRVKGVADA